MKKVTTVIIFLFAVLSGFAQKSKTAVSAKDSATMVANGVPFRVALISLPTGCQTMTSGCPGMDPQCCICNCQCWQVSYWGTPDAPIITGAVLSTGCTNNCSGVGYSGSCGNTLMNTVYELARAYLMEHDDAYKLKKVAKK